jgi:transposase-like protein
MKKEDIRKEFFKLRMKKHSYNQCRKILQAQFGFGVTIRTLQRWSRKLEGDNWDLMDESRKPKTIHRKITADMETEVIKLRKETGWGEDKITDFVEIGHTSINKILNRNGLTNPNPRRRKRIKYIRWQRKHPNSLWQMDVSDQKIKDKYCFAVIDDCSRYCLGLFALNRISTSIITKLLDDIIKIHGKPREFLTDNGQIFGLRSVHSKFDRWCRKRDIKHIRTAIHSPTTSGKIERFFQTLDRELRFCRDAEHFKMRYNHFRPHTSLERKTPSSVYFRG